MSGSTIQFTNLPAATLRVHGIFAEVDLSKANSAQQDQPSLLMGQILSTGTATANVPIQATSRTQVRTLCGVGSMLALMYDAYRAKDPFGTVWLLPIADNGAGTAATGSVVFTHASTGPGTFPLYVGGVPCFFAVGSADSATTLATNLAAQLALQSDLPLTGSPSTATVSLTANHKGAALTDIDLRVAYGGAPAGEAVPAGVAYTITAMSGGATNPTLTTALANLAEQRFDFIAFPWTDSTSLAAIKNFLSDATGRWSWSKQLFGGAFSAFRGTAGALGTFGVAQNDAHMDVLGYYDSPTPAWLEAADWCAVHAASLRVDPALPMQEVALGLQPPPLQSRFDISARNTLLYQGISTFVVGNDGTVRIDRSITTYQQNPSGQPDDSELDVETMYQLQFGIRFMRTSLSSQFARKKLVADGSRIAGGTNTVSPSIVFGAAIAIYQQMVVQGIMQDLPGFIANGSAQLGTRGQVRMLLPFNVAGQLRQIDMLIQLLHGS